MELDQYSMEGDRMTRTSCTFSAALTLAVFATASLFSFSAQAKHQDLSAKVIYGKDNRLDLYQVNDTRLRELAASTVALMSAGDVTIDGTKAHLKETIIGPYYGLCSDEPFYNQNSAAFCSGFLVAPDTIASAGHCIRSQASCEDTKFVFDFVMNSAGDRAVEVPASNVYSCKQLIHSVANGHGEDFSVVKLDRPVSGRRPLSLAAQTPSRGTPLTVIGYPIGLPVKVAGGASVRDLKPEFLVANLDTFGGNSGSAVFNTNTGAVEGILVRGERDFITDGACRRSNVCTDSGCRGEDVTLIKQTFPYLEQ
jgi:V8-like Glu-specific endopeptidase